MGNIICAVLCFTLLSSFGFSIGNLELLEPKTTIFPSEQVDYGYVGPGQTFTIQIEPIVRESNGDFRGQWDIAEVVSLPQDWEAKHSKIYANPLVLEVSAPPDAEPGDYLLSVIVIDEKGQENIGDFFEFDVLVTVRHEVLDLDVSPSHLSVGAGQPARFSITLNNLGSAKDVFSINAKGVKGWEFERKIYLPPGTSKSLVYEIIGQDESSYDITFSAVSDSSNLIEDEQTVSLNVHTDLLSDYKATSHGVLLFPIISSPIYSLAGLIALLFA